MLQNCLRERHLFEKRLSSPHPIFQKLLQELLLPLTIKAIPIFCSSLKINLNILSSNGTFEQKYKTA